MFGLFPLSALLKKKKKTALLLTNQNGEIFSCLLLGIKQVFKGLIISMKKILHAD